MVFSWWYVEHCHFCDVGYEGWSDDSLSGHVILCSCDP